ncbi:MAG: hypothetical protein HYU58_08945 [Proteobacteria bacterium]|nr:hypothetical protein [Pseudomonadota bacterium]
MVFHLGAPHTVPYEAAAIFMTLLAYPQYQNDERRLDRATTAVCHMFLRSNPERDARWLTEVSAMWAHIFPTFNVDSELKGFFRKLNDRMHAARIAISFLQEIELGHLPKLPKAMKRLSLNEWANVDLAPDRPAGGDETGNLETRIWRPSLPVLHLAIAVQKILASADNHGNSLNLLHFFLEEELLQQAIDEAEVFARELQKVTRFKWAYESRIQVAMAVGSNFLPNPT